MQKFEGHMICEDGIEQMILINKDDNEVNQTVKHYNRTNKQHVYISKKVIVDIMETI